jgi:hypothetical protein
MRTLTLSTLVVVCLACSGVAIAGNIQIDSVGATRALECQGRGVVVNGSSNNLTLLGDCPQVVVNGTSQRVQIERAGSITVNGVGNTVVWAEGLNGKSPNVQKNGLNLTVRQGAIEGRGGSGTGTGGTEGRGTSVGVSSTTNEEGEVETKITGTGGSVDVTTSTEGRQVVTVGGGRAQAESTSAPEVITIAKSDTVETIECNGSDLKIDGNDNTLRLNGECGKIIVNGNRNMLRIASAATIAAVGNENTILWVRGAGGTEPRISDIGTNNTIRRAEP